MSTKLRKSDGTFIYADDLVGGSTSIIFVDKETPVGVIDGTNKVFTLAHVPTAGSEHIYINGLLQVDFYTITGAVITLDDAPETGSNIRVSYRR